MEELENSHKKKGVGGTSDALFISLPGLKRLGNSGNIHRFNQTLVKKECGSNHVIRNKAQQVTCRNKAIKGARCSVMAGTALYQLSTTGQRVDKAIC